ncbi:MAG: EAL domain-containing protein [Gammaproteobacteria bacterium]|nr:EAL domain-containing protein [Gammaproteobacteria bacterium]
MSHYINRKANFQQIRRCFSLITASAFLFIPLTCLILASYTGLFDHYSLYPLWKQNLIWVIAVAMFVISRIHFWRFMNIFKKAFEEESTTKLSPVLNRNLARFHINYWGLLLHFVIFSVLAFYITTTHLSSYTERFTETATLAILYLAVTALIGIPLYFQAFNKLGRLIAYIELDRIRVSLKLRTFLLGGIYPLLTSAVLLGYISWRTDIFKVEFLLAWFGLGVTTIMVAWLSLNGITQSLKPVINLLKKNGMDKHSSSLIAAQLTPQSSDEIGYLTQELSTLFQTMGDQDEKLTYQVEHDSLTGLYNRHYFNAALEKLIERVANRDTQCMLFYIDLDRFKEVNDTLGHASGDRLLIECAQMMETHTRDGDLLARLGGDEFTIILHNTNNEKAEYISNNLLAMFEEYRFVEDGRTFNISCSIGMTLINHSSHSVDEVISQADQACHTAKAAGRNQAKFYEYHESSEFNIETGWAGRVRHMLDNDDHLQLVYQPIISIPNGKIIEFEVLVRMITNSGKTILPGGFIAAAERFDLIQRIDRVTTQKAISKLAQMDSNISFSINLSGRSLDNDELLTLIRNQIKATGIDASRLTFEINESTVITNMNAVSKFIKELNVIGCHFVMDDFGSGFSSFYYLKHLPIDKIKIYGSLVRDLKNNKVNQAMVQSIHQIAHAMGKQTIAKSVENGETFQLLKGFGVDFAQGYFIGKPEKDIHKFKEGLITTQPFIRSERLL